MGVEYGSVTDLIRSLGALPKAVKEELGPGLLEAAQIIADRAKENASYSTRIPAAIYAKPRFTATSPGAVVGVSAVKAPEAKVLELGNAGSRSESFRHPVFATSTNRSDWTWTTQKRQPFLFPALTEKRKEALAVVARAVAEAARIEGLT